MSFRTSNDIIIDQNVISDVTSESVDLSNQYLVAVQASWSNGSSPSIEIKIEVSLDNENWAELSSPSISISTASGSEVMQLDNFAYKHMRILADHTSGSADVKVVFNGKGI